METHPRAVATDEREQRSAGGTSEHARDRPEWVPVVAKDVADAGAVARADRWQCVPRRRLVLVHDDEARVVLDSRAALDRAHEVVDLLARRPRSAGAEPELLVECADAGDHLG